MYRGRHRGPVTVRPTIPTTVWVLLGATLVTLILLLLVPNGDEWAQVTGSALDWANDWAPATLLVTAPLIGGAR